MSNLVTIAISAEYAGHSTTCSGIVYRTRSLALNTFNGTLAGHDLHLDLDNIDFDQPEGVKRVDVLDEFDHYVTLAHFYWHTVDGGYDFASYLR